MSEDGMFQLIQEAMDMLRDRALPERELIYYIAKLDDMERGAIILAYQALQHKEES